jgi:hypothetical protein
LPALQAEVDRLQEVLKKLIEAAPAQRKGALSGFGQQLTQVRQQASPSVFAYELREPFVMVELWDFFRTHSEASKDLQHLEALWTAEKGRFAAHPDAATQASPLVVALAQASANHAEKLYRAALPYGKAAGTPAGLYYLSEAEAHMRFHDFVVTLSLPAGPETPGVPDAAVLRTALEGLEGEMQKGFAADPGGQEMIPASALLKEGRELLERDDRAGAALTLLAGRLELSRHRRPATPVTGGAPAPVEPVPEGSLIAPFIPMTAGEQDETARIVRADVIPLYRSFFGKKP